MRLRYIDRRCVADGFDMAQPLIVSSVFQALDQRDTRCRVAFLETADHVQEHIARTLAAGGRLRDGFEAGRVTARRPRLYALRPEIDRGIIVAGLARVRRAHDPCIDE